MEQQLNHFNASGQAHMVNVGDKEITERLAVAGGRIRMQPQTFAVITQGSAKKGDVLGIARIAGIMAVKKTPELIPLAHPIPLSGCEVEFLLHEEQNEIEAVCSVRVTARTGAEMEALSGAAAALLTIYDMVKAIDRGMEIGQLCVYRKSGGKSGEYVRND